MSKADDVLWLTEQDVAQTLGLAGAVRALERSVVLEHQGQARNMTKTMLQYGHSNLHALGGQLGGVVGVKSWVHAEKGTAPMLLLWDAVEGRLLAAIEAFALGNLRTGGTSGLATKWMAAPDAKTMAILGCGKQALAQAAAVAAVRPLQQVRAFARTLANARAFAEKATQVLGIPVTACASVEEATAGADVITTATRAAEPFLRSVHLKDGAHLNAIGAIGPDREEFAQDVFDRAHAVCVDHLAGAQRLSREFMRRYGEGDWTAVRSLGALVAEGRPCWRTRGVTVFKAMGMGLSDVALGVALLEHARGAGLGRAMPAPRKAAIDFNKPTETTTN